MPSRRFAGFVSAFYNPLQVPDAPTSVSANASNGSANVSFTAPTNTGGGSITGYGAVAIGTNISSTNTSSPITISGLTSGTTYTIGVWAINSYGPSPFGISGEVIPTGDRGLFFGGYGTGGSVSNGIEYITISSTGNSIDFGDLLLYFSTSAGCSSATRGLIGGGRNGFSGTNAVNYITIATTGNALDFGDLTVTRDFISSASNSTRGIWGGGDTNAVKNIIDYVTISSAGNATDFGDLTQSRSSAAGCASTTRAVFGGGAGTGTTPTYATIDYVTIASAGNATSFGSLSQSRGWAGACSSSTRGLFGGGFNEPGPQFHWNIIDYITIATTGVTTDFGDLIFKQRNMCATSDQTRGVWAGGEQDTLARTNVIQYVTMSSTGNALDFGDLLSPRDNMAACSNGHGGL